MSRPVGIQAIEARNGTPLRSILAGVALAVAVAAAIVLAIGAVIVLSSVVLVSALG